MPSFAVSVGAWLTRVTKSERPPADIEAYNIGIFESDGGFQLYLVGAKAYDPLDSDWACDEDFVPREKYFKLASEKKLKTWKDAEIAVRSCVEKFLAARGETPIGASLGERSARHSGQRASCSGILRTHS